MGKNINQEKTNFSENQQWLLLLILDFYVFKKIAIPQELRLLIFSFSFLAPNKLGNLELAGEKAWGIQSF